MEPEYSYRYWAFLSYCSHDRVVARWLQRSLEAYSVPSRLIGRPTPAGPAPKYFRPIFRDRTDLPADSDLRASIMTALSQSAYLVVLCSPQSAQSHWVNDEIIAFRAQRGSSYILSVIVAGTVTGEQNCFPPALRHNSQPGRVVDSEPIAADLRPGGDGRRITCLKLAAGMLGVGLDEIVRRDRQRRHRTLIIATAASIVGMALMGVLTTTAFIARNESQRQRSHAESLIEFMLTDLRKALEPSGRLDAMDGVGREALKYYSAQRPGDLGEPALARQARALRLMGEIRVQRGDLNDARSSFEQAAGATAELLKRSPNSTRDIFNHAQNVFWVGEIAHQRGDATTAETWFREYRRLAGQLTTQEPNNDDWTAEVSYAESALGILFLENGRPAEAATAFRQSLAVNKDLADRHPADLTAQVNLGQAHAWLADALRKEGQLAEARSHREIELAIYGKVLAVDPTVRQAKFSMIISSQVLGELMLLGGDELNAIAQFKDAASRAEALLLTERSNMDLTAVAADEQIELGEVQLATGQIGAARTAQERANALLKVALAHDDTVSLWRDYRHRAIQLEAALAAKEHHFAQALQIDEPLLRSLESIGTDQVNTVPFWLLQRSRLQTGDDLAALGRSAEAQKEWVAIVNSLAAVKSNVEPKLLTVLAAADLRLGRSSEAATITHRLTSLYKGADGGEIRPSE
jgi:tetratricopeptide (TPR) repeat protein